MTPAEILQWLWQRGITVTINAAGDGLEARQDGKLPPKEFATIIARVKSNRDRILDYVWRQGCGNPSPWRDVSREDFIAALKSKEPDFPDWRANEIADKAIEMNAGVIINGEWLAITRHADVKGDDKPWWRRGKDSQTLDEPAAAADEA